MRQGGDARRIDDAAGPDRERILDLIALVHARDARITMLVERIHTVSLGFKSLEGKLRGLSKAIDDARREIAGL